MFGIGCFIYIKKVIESNDIVKNGNKLRTGHSKRIKRSFTDNSPGRKTTKISVLEIHQ